MSSKTTVDFWFDPVCPWAWMTSRWILEVEKVRDIEVRWNIMSLQVLNEPKLDELSGDYRDMIASGRIWKPVRVIAAAQHKYGRKVLGDLYTALGTRFHPQGRQDDEVLSEAIAELGLSSDLIDAASSTRYDDEIRQSHAAGIGLVGEDVGTPVVALAGPDGEQIAFFGPVVTPAPKGEAAGKLWDGAVLVAQTPGFYELKRTRQQGPIFD